jgi:hypothetical protein
VCVFGGKGVNQGGLLTMLHRSSLPAISSDTCSIVQFPVPLSYIRPLTRNPVAWTVPSSKLNVTPWNGVFHETVIVAQLF